MKGPLVVVAFQVSYLFSLVPGFPLSFGSGLFLSKAFSFWGLAESLPSGYIAPGGGEMEKEEIIGILKHLLGEEDIDFLRKLDEDELVKLLVVMRDKIGLSKSVH